MRIALVSDIHGNLLALEAVAADIQRRGADLIVNLGDIASGPLWPGETVDWLMARTWPTIAGNHERQALAPDLSRMGPSDRYAAERLRPDQRTWLSELPRALWLDDVPGQRVRLCHGTPDSDMSYFLETVTGDFDPAARRDGVRMATRAEALARAGGEPAGLILCGHTHQPRVMAIDAHRLVVNPGSVGLPAYDDDAPCLHVVQTGCPHARYAMVEWQGRGWQSTDVRVLYDFAAAAQQAESNGRGDWADALRTGFVGRTQRGRWAA